MHVRVKLFTHNCQKKEKQSIWRNWEYVLEGSAWFPSTVCNCNLM